MLQLAAVLMACFAGDDPEDFVFLGPDRPVFVRVSVNVDGRSHVAPFSAWLKEVFTACDADGDGLLSADEARKLPAEELFRSAESKGTKRNADWKPDGDGDGKVTLDEFRATVEQSVGPSLAVRMTGPAATVQQNFAAQAPTTDARSAQLVFRQLDSDQTKSLSAEELSRANLSIRKLDRDDDDSLSLQELAGTNPYQAYVVNQQPTESRSSVPFVRLGAHMEVGRTVRRFVQQYDRRPGDAAPDLRLSRDEIKIPEAEFQARDRNGDGGLDDDEVREFLQSAVPQIECRFHLEVNWSRDPPIEVLLHDSQLPAELRKSSSGEITIVLAAAQIELAQPASNTFNSSSFLEQQYQAADTDSNGYVDRKEAQQSYYINQSFRAADADKDGKLFAPELRAFLQSRQKAGDSRTVLELVDTGRNLFEILDVNRDRRMSAAEVRRLADRVPGWDADRDGELHETEVPQHFRLSARRGGVQIPGLNFALSDGQQVPGVVSQPRGTAWFRKMDRNGDGEVSRREFLGQPEVFDKLDADRNQSLDPQEAEAVK